MNRTLSALALGAAVVATAPSVAQAADTAKQEALIADSRATFDRIAGSKEAGPTLPNLLKRARAVMIFPQILKGAFFIGGSGGSGVLLARTGTGWSGPAFYDIGSVSFGLQLGGQSSETVLVIMTQKGLEAVLNNQAKLGADASIAAGPVGGGAAAATGLAQNADMYSFSAVKGLFAGVSLDGAVVAADEDLEKGLYGAGATTRAIVTTTKYNTPAGASLRADLGKY